MHSKILADVFEIKGKTRIKLFLKNVSVNKYFRLTGFKDYNLLIVADCFEDFKTSTNRVWEFSS